MTILIKTTINGRRLKITRIFVCKCHYLGIKFAKIWISIKMVEKHKIEKNQQTFYKCNMCNKTIKITLYCITTRKAAKRIKNIVNAVDMGWLTFMIDKSKDKPISEIPLSRSNKNEKQWILWCHSSQYGWSKVQSPQSNPFSIKYLLQETISE